MSIHNSAVFESVDELARHLRISRAKTYQELRAGNIPSIRLGRRFILPRAAISIWLSSARPSAEIGA